MIFSAVMKVSKVMTLSGLSQGRKLLPSLDVLLSMRLTATITDAIAPLSLRDRHATPFLFLNFALYLGFLFVLFCSENLQ